MNLSEAFLSLVDEVKSTNITITFTDGLFEIKEPISGWCVTSRKSTLLEILSKVNPRVQANPNALAEKVDAEKVLNYVKETGKCKLVVNRYDWNGIKRTSTF